MISCKHQSVLHHAIEKAASGTQDGPTTLEQTPAEAIPTTRFKLVDM
jgi:hypothetical protein